MNGVRLVFRFSVFVERESQRMPSLNVPTLHILDAEQPPGAATAAEAECPRLWGRDLLQSSAQKELARIGDPGDAFLSP